MTPIQFNRAGQAIVRALLIPILGCAAMAVAATTPADKGVDSETRTILASLRSADMRLATIHYRLVSANRSLCDRRAGITGLVLHTLAAYRPPYRIPAQSFFQFAGPVAIEGVVVGSPAARAGFIADDSIVSIAGVAIDAPAEATVTAVSAIQAQIAESAAGGPVAVGIIRNGVPGTIPITVEQGCAGHAEVDVSRVLNAATDGTTIQINSALINLLSDDNDLAAIIAHELAHVVMHHQERLTAAKVDRGLLRDFGRNARLIRQTEIEADRLSVYLLANAGFDPANTSRFLTDYARPLHVNSILAGRTHLRGKERVKLIDAEAATVARSPDRPIVPAWLANRTTPLE